MITLWMVYSLIVSLALAVSASMLDRVRRAGSAENDVVMLKVRPAQQTFSPDGLRAIQPNDIATATPR